MCVSVYFLHATTLISVLVVRVPINCLQRPWTPLTDALCDGNWDVAVLARPAVLIKSLLGPHYNCHNEAQSNIRCIGWQACIDDTLQHLAAAANARAIHMLSTPPPPCTMRQAEGAAASAYSQRETGFSMH